MRIKDAEPPLLSGLTGHVLLEAAEDVGQGRGIIPGLGGGADANAVGLAFLAAAVMAQPRAAYRPNRGVDQRAQVFPHHTADHIAGQGKQAGQDPFALLPG